MGLIDSVIEIGAKGVGQIIDYFLASAERRAEIRAKADADELRLYDLVDNKLLENNAVIDKLADEKFGPKP